MLFKSVLLVFPLFAQSLVAASQHGKVTYYEQNGIIGSCGQAHTDADLIVALSPAWQQNASPGPYCGRRVHISDSGGGVGNYGAGKTVVATVADSCPSCVESHLDLSHAAFMALTGGVLDPPGTFGVQWHFCGATGEPSC